MRLQFAKVGLRLSCCHPETSSGTHHPAHTPSSHCIQIKAAALSTAAFCLHNTTVRVAMTSRILSAREDSEIVSTVIQHHAQRCPKADAAAPPLTSLLDLHISAGCLRNMPTVQAHLMTQAVPPTSDFRCAPGACSCRSCLLHVTTTTRTHGIQTTPRPSHIACIEPGRRSGAGQVYAEVRIPYCADRGIGALWDGSCGSAPRTVHHPCPVCTTPSEDALVELDGDLFSSTASRATAGPLACEPARATFEGDNLLLVPAYRCAPLVPSARVMLCYTSACCGSAAVRAAAMLRTRCTGLLCV